MPVQDAPEIWQDPEQMPCNPATLLDAICLQAARVLAAAARSVTPDTATCFKILSRAKAVDSRLATWPSLVPQDWWPIPLDRDMVPTEVAEAGLHGDHCDIYPDISICDSWLNWRFTRLKILGLIADYEQTESKHDAMLEFQQVTDDILAAVPFMLGSKCKPADMFDTVFKYPCLPGTSVLRSHYYSAAAFGGLTLWSPLKTILEHARHLRKDQMQFALQQIRRLGTLYDVRMPKPKGPP
ncbi:MAG: hypothetical protein L6R39_006790 [Caloplaca ligustica]|nr:MAG: hypothetical protein L6R39_006790 [Caloplaca ligustica]